MRQTGEPNAWMIALSGGVFALLLLAGLFAMQAYFSETEQEENARKVVAVAPEELALARAQQAGQINSYRWVDRNTGVVAIPIDIAMELVAKEGLAPSPAPPAVRAEAVPRAGAGAKRAK